MPSVTLPSLPTSALLFPILLLFSLPLIPFALLTTFLAVLCLAIRGIFIYAELGGNLLKQQLLYGGADDPSAPVSLALSEYSLKPGVRSPGDSRRYTPSSSGTQQRSRRGSRPLYSHSSSGSITPARRPSTPYASYGSPPPATTTGTGSFSNVFGPATSTVGVYGGGSGAGSGGGYGFYSLAQGSGSSVSASGVQSASGMNVVNSGSGNSNAQTSTQQGTSTSTSNNAREGANNNSAIDDRDYEGVGGWRDVDDEDTDGDVQWTSMNRRLELPSGARTPGGSSATNNFNFNFTTSGPNSVVNGSSGAGDNGGPYYTGPRSAGRPGHRRSNTGGSIHLERGFSALNLRSLKRANDGAGAGGAGGGGASSMTASTYSTGSNGGNASNKPRSLYAGSASQGHGPGNGYGQGHGYASGSGSGSASGSGSGDYAFLTTNVIGHGGHMRLSGTASPEDGAAAGGGGGLAMKSRSLVDMDVEEMNVGRARSVAGAGSAGSGGVGLGAGGGGVGTPSLLPSLNRRKSGSSSGSSGGQSGRTINGGGGGGGAGMTAAGGWMAP